MKNKILSGIRFVRMAFEFSNPLQLIVEKIMTRGVYLAFQHHEYRLFSCEIPCWDSVAIRECLVEKAYDTAIKMAKPAKGPGSYINIGANIGAFDVAVYEQWGRDARGVSVEMNPWTCARLLNNICYNQLPVCVINAAIAGKPGKIKINLKESHSGQSIYDKVSAETNTEIEALTLAQIQSPVAGKDIDLLKVDCEGAEYELFLAAGAQDFKRFKHIVMELHAPPSSEYTKEQLIEHIQKTGGYESMPLKNSKNSLIFFTKKSSAQ